MEADINIYNNLEDESTKWISLFHELIESEECSQLKYKCLIVPVTKIIQNKYILDKMCKLNTLGFDSIYKKHFIQKKNTFVLFNDPYESMCAELLMIKYH